MVSSLDLNLLRLLHVVITERNVARAASRLHVTPSAVSNALARLRDVLQDPLIVRKGRGIVPTPRALELAPAIARALTELDSALSSGGFDPKTTTRTFTLAVADVGQIIYVPRIVAAMRRQLPNAQLRVIGIDSLVALGNLASSDVDLQIGLAPSGPGIHTEALFDERTVLVAGPRHRALGRRLTKAELSKLRHVRIDMVPGRGLKDAVAAAYEKANLTRNVVLTVPSFTAAAAAVAASDLVATLPRRFLRHHAARLGLRELVGPIPVTRVPMSLAWHDRTHQDAAAKAFRSLVAETCRTLAGV